MYSPTKTSEEVFGLDNMHVIAAIRFSSAEWCYKKHFLSKHGRNITREEIVNWTTTRYYERETRRLEILESLIIRYEDPEINKQDTGKRRKLRLYGTAVLTSSPQE